MKEELWDIWLDLEEEPPWFFYLMSALTLMLCCTISFSVQNDELENPTGAIAFFVMFGFISTYLAWVGVSKQVAYRTLRYMRQIVALTDMKEEQLASLPLPYARWAAQRLEWWEYVEKHF